MAEQQSPLPRFFSNHRQEKLETAGSVSSFSRRYLIFCNNRRRSRAFALRPTLFRATDFISSFQNLKDEPRRYSTVTLLARLRGLSTSVPRAHAVWYDSSCSGIVCRMGDSLP